MTKTEILNTILGIEGAQMGRANKSNFVIVPCEDGYVKVGMTVALAQDTKNHKAFNMEAAVAEYKAYEAEKALKEAEKANKPVKEKGVNVEAQARRDALDNAIASLPSFTDATATNLLDALTGVIPENTTVMAVGSSAMRLVDKGVLTVTFDEKKKKHYTKA